MLRDTTLRQQLEAYRVAEAAERRTRPDQDRPGGRGAELAAPDDIEFLPYGATDLMSPLACPVLGALAPVEIEYAALRRGAGILDAPQRAVFELSGADRVALLDRLLTAPLANLAAGSVSRSFLLGRKGRIEADLTLIDTGERTLVMLDAHQLAATIETLDRYVIADDVAIADRSDELYVLMLHGPQAAAVVEQASGASLQDDATTCSIAGATIVTARRDETGATGYALIVPRTQVPAVWTALLETDASIGEGRRRIRPVGWFAYNIARIEAGTPLFNIDFGTSNLPAESGLLEQRVSMTKGCYLGQEVVARMHNLGRPKQVLVGLRMQGDALPVEGAAVRTDADDAASEVGVVTSSTLSPMLGAAPIAFAMIRTAAAGPGAAVYVEAEGAMEAAVVGPLRFWPEAEPA